jgi:uncharacterized protein (TIGR02453 family)
MLKQPTFFTGFAPETFQFFTDLSENNRKVWFDDHKPVYQSAVLQPLQALANALTPFFASLDSEMDLRPARMVSRIYRDIRFSPDKTPYKRHMWLSFQRAFPKQAGDWMSFPGFYMEIGQEGSNYGMGLFEAQKKIMDRYRESIEYNPLDFSEKIDGLVETHGYCIEGELYKRPLPNRLGARFQPWIQRKGIWLTKHIPGDHPILFSDRLTRHMEEEFILLQPLYDFLVDICE